MSALDRLRSEGSQLAGGSNPSRAVWDDRDCVAQEHPQVAKLVGNDVGRLGQARTRRKSKEKPAHKQKRGIKGRGGGSWIGRERPTRAVKQQ